MSQRWMILITGVLANLCISSAYAFSVFTKPLMDKFGWTQSQVAFLFTALLVIMPITMLVAGKIQDSQGPRKTFFFAGIAFGLGWLLSGFVESLMLLYILFGGLAGLGLGAIYSCTVVNTVRWFPDKRGLAAGLISAGLSIGPVFLAPLAVMLIQEYGVMDTIKIYGIAFMACTVFASLFSVAPPAGYVPEGWTPPVVQNTTIPEGKDWRAMLQDRMFYVGWLMLMLASISGLMLIGNASLIAQDMLKLTPQEAGATVGMLAVGNATGRILWGWTSDKLGRYKTMILMFSLSAISMITLSTVSSYGMYVFCTCLIATCYGGFFALFPAVTGDMFGVKNLGANWGIMFTAFAPAAVIGPLLVAKVKELYNGDYSVAFIIAASLSIIGAILALYSQRAIAKRSS